MDGERSGSVILLARLIERRTMAAKTRSFLGIKEKASKNFGLIKEVRFSRSLETGMIPRQRRRAR